MKPTDFSYHLSNYLSKYLPGVSGLSPNTILSYRDTFTAMIQFFEDSLGIKAEKITLETFSADHVAQYLDWLEQERGNTVSTRNNRLAAIHAFAKYVERRSPEKMHAMQEIVAIPIKRALLQRQSICPLKHFNCCCHYRIRQPGQGGGIVFF